MRAVLAALVALTVLYFVDKDFNHGNLLDGLARRHVASHFPQYASLMHEITIINLHLPNCQALTNGFARSCR
jgi:hypothetical protein